jgi:hypothetical protein
MFGRRDPHHHVAPVSRLLAAAALALALGLSAGPAEARRQAVGRDGTVHGVSVETWPSQDSPTRGTALRYTRQDAGGSGTESALVPGTDDLLPDREPTLDLVGSTEPVVIWSRLGVDRFDLVASRMELGYWSPIRTVFPGPAEERRPDLYAGAAWLHVVWAVDGAEGTSWFRGVLAPGTLREAYGPERLPTQHAHPLVPVGGEPGPGVSPEPERDRFYVVRALFPKDPGSSGKLFLWGVRDEPVPIDYLQGFLLPLQVRDVGQANPLWLNGRLMVSFQTTGWFYYTLRLDGRWTDLRAVRLDAGTTPLDALLEVEEMLRKDAAALGE